MALFRSISSNLVSRGRFQVDHHAGEPLAMDGCVAEGGLGSLGSPVVKMKVIFPGETHPSVDLNSAVPDRAAGFAGVELGDGDGAGRIGSVLLESPRRIV